MSITGQTRWPSMRQTASFRHVTHGLPALVIGGALVLAIIWATSLGLANMMARMQVEQRMSLVAEKVRDVMKDNSRGVLSDKTREALAHLARFLDVHHLEILDASGRSLWHGEAGPHPLVRPTRTGKTVIEEQVVDGLSRTVARHYANFPSPVGKVHVIIMSDVSDIITGYRRIGIFLAKAFSSVVLIAIFLIGWLLILRWREERALMEQVRAMLHSAPASPTGNATEDDRQVRALVEQASQQNVAFLRQVLALAKMADMQERPDPRAMDAGANDDAHGRRTAQRR